MACGSDPLVTVYVLNCNYGRFLRQAVDSVLAQNYSPLEILVVDDASDDCSSDVLTEFADNPRVRVLRQPVNLGLTASSNNALRVASGEFVMRLDADDYLEPFAVGTMVDALVADPSAVLVFPDYTEVDARGVTVRRVQRHDFNTLQAMSDLPAHGACTLVRRNFLDSVGGYDEDVGCQDGLDLWLHVGQEHRVAHVREPLFHYRRHGSSLTTDERPLLAGRGKLIAKHVAQRGLARPKVLGVVPVRGQAADADSMPLRRLGDRSLIDWTVDAALACDGIDRAVVTSPDTIVLDHVVARYGDRIGVHHRRRGWAGLNSDLAATVKHVIATEADEGSRYDAEMTLTIEYPFRSSAFMQQAIHLMQLFDTDLVVGVRNEDEYFYRHDGLGLEPLRVEEKLRLERDDLFRACGGLRLVRMEPAGSSSRTGHVLLDQVAAFAIRTEIDWKIAESLIEFADGGGR